MNSAQSLPDAGWFRDAARPWTAHRWDGKRWTGETNDGRTLPLSATPSAPPNPSRRVELDELPRRMPTTNLPMGLLPLAGGVLIALVLLPRLYDGLESALLGAPLDQVVPIWLLPLWGAGIGLALYGIVTLAMVRALRDRG